MSGTTLFVNEFSFSRIDYERDHELRGPTIAIIGKRGTGKSYFLRDLLYFFKDIPRILVFSGSEKYNQYFSKFIPAAAIHYEYKRELIEQLITDQERRLEEWRHDHSKDPRIIVVLDDCMWDDTFTKDKLMQFLYFNGRHLRVLLAITMQDPIGLPPRLRGNTDYIFLMNEPNPVNRDKIHHNYAQAVINHRNEFDRIMDLMTQDNDILVLDNYVKANTLKDRIFYFRAKERLNFRCGSAELWNRPAGERNAYRQGISKPNGQSFQLNIERRGLNDTLPTTAYRGNSGYGNAGGYYNHGASAPNTYRSGEYNNYGSGYNHLNVRRG